VKERPKKTTMCPARWEAVDAGRTYYQGAECYMGHSGLRYAKDGSCVKCCQARGQRIYVKRKRLRNKFISIPNWGKDFDNRVAEPLRKYLNADDEGIIVIALSKLRESITDPLQRR
jgi:hypothetical protein